MGGGGVSGGRAAANWFGGTGRVGHAGANLGVGRVTGTSTAERAARANSRVVRYRCSGSLAMPVAITVSKAGDTPGWVVDGSGGGVVKCATICCSTLFPG